MKRVILKKDNEIEEFFCNDNLSLQEDEDSNKLEKTIDAMVSQLCKSNYNIIINFMNKIKMIYTKDDLDKFINDFLLT